ncbi:MAG: amino acid adenylation domain-containing protein, partial [Pyrinomonadaceae bacterium]
LVVAVLGVIKAGGAYVPLDPAYPHARLSFILADTQAPVLLTRTALLGSVPESAAQVVCIDEAREADASGGRATPAGVDGDAARESASAAVAAGDNLAYVMYTSGSTGAPKGVAVTQRAVARLVRNTDYVGLGPGDVVAQASNVSFDASTFEIWGALLNGARLVVAPPGRLSLAEVGRFIERHGVTTLWLTAGLFHLMADERPADLGRLRQLLAGGDVLSAPHVNRLLAESEGLTLINGYGPTENTTFTCCHRMSAGERCETTVPIGRPISNTRVYLLDSRMIPVPVGFYGELYAGGDGLARGYHNRPALTAERFIPDPFADEPGARLYRTGDLARWRADGTIEFLGRRDQQLKVRGFRVEPGEVEAALLGVAGVREAVVEARGDGASSKWLVAYVVWDEAVAGVERREAELRRRLGESLPEYMIPSAFVALERLPLTPNGKVDRRALPEPEAGGSLAEYEGPRTGTEERLCAIWGEVLGLPQVGVRSNFFELGGHSLLATQVISRVRAAFEVELPLRSLFESPTVAELAREVDHERRAGTDATAPPVERIPREGALPLSFAQQRLWFLDQLKPGSSAYNLSSAVFLRGRLSVPALEQTLDEIVRRHEVLRTTFAEIDGQPAQVIHPAASQALPLTDLNGLAGPEREAALRRMMTEEANRPFDLTKDSLLRATLARLGEEEHALFVTMHHIVSDGWSMGVLIRELMAHYSAFSRGEESPLSELPVQYADYAVWQREHLSGERLDAQLGYWKEQLAGAPALLTLPTDRPRPPVQGHRGATLPFNLSAELTQRLLALSRRHGCTLFMTLLAAWQALMSRYSGQEDVVVGTPIAGRTRTETEDLIGFFVNTLALRTDLSGDPSFEELLGRVRETTLGAYAHQDVPFERLVEELQPERSLSHQPVFQIVFAWQNAPRGALRLPGLELESLGREVTTAKFDLVLNMWEAGGALSAGLEYNTDLFDAETARRMTAHLSRLLEAAAAEPSARVGDLRLLSDEEEREFFAEASQASQASQGYAAEPTTLTQLFARQARLTPAAVAVEGGGERLTYAELDARADALARRLRALGVGPEVPVAVMLERSAWLVVAALATLKAGGAYVPLDPEYPRSRLSFILADTQAPVLLTQTALLGSVPESAAHVLCVDEAREADADEAEVTRGAMASVAAAAPANLCYVIYTSGSTGRPKGVGVTHAAAAEYLSWAAAAYSPGRPARMALY